MTSSKTPAVAEPMNRAASPSFLPLDEDEIGAIFKNCLAGQAKRLFLFFGKCYLDGT